MSDMMMPSYWVGGMGNPGAGLQNAYAQQAQNNNYFANQQGVGAIGQNTLNNLYGAGGFGAQPAYYAGVGAAYGRATGGFGGYGGDVWSQGAPAYNDYGGAADINWMLGGSQGQRPSEAYNASRQYGWDANEGAAAPAAPQVYNRGEFNPQTYGWDHNEGATNFGGPADQQWMLNGSVGQRPSTMMGGGDAFSFNPTPMGGGNNAFGGLADQQWMLGGSIGPRPSSGGGIGSDAARVPAAAPQMPQMPVQSQDWQSTFTNMVHGNPSNPYPLGGFGGSADEQWYLGGSQGPRPSSQGGGGYDIGGQSRSVQSPLQGFDWAQSYMPNSTGGGMQQALLASQYQPFAGAGGGGFGGAADQAWYLAGSQGARPSSTAGFDPWASNNTRTPDYSNMFGAPNSGYLGAQGRLVQDPFGAYVNPQSLDAGGSFPGNYQPGYTASPFTPLGSS